MKSQSLNDDFIVHNLNPEEIIGEDPSRQHREIPNPFDIIDIQQSVEEFMGDEIKEEQPKAIEKPKLVEKSKQNLENKFVAWCLPAILKEEINSLYGEVKRSLSYGEKFSLETVVINRNIVSIDLWSPIKIDKNSIIYLWDQREWWRVTKIIEQTDGWLLTCFPSEHHPSF